MNDNNKLEAIKNVRISALGTLASGVFQLLTLTIMTRILKPSEYGEYAICWSLASLFPVLVNNINERSDIIEKDTIIIDGRALIDFTLSFISSFVIVLLALCYNKFISNFLNINLLMLTCFAVSIYSLSISKRVVLRRSVRFAPIVTSEMLGLIIGQGLVAVLAASFGLGALSLALGLLIQNLVISVTLLRGGTKCLKFFSVSLLIRTIKKSFLMSGNVTLEIVNGQVSPLMLGFRLGTVAVGLFNRVYGIVQIPIQLMINSLSRVVISVLFGLAHDEERFVKASRKMIVMATIMTAPVAAGMAGSGTNFILSIFGRNWIEAAEILPWISLSGVTMMIAALFGTICEAQRMLKAKFIVQLFSTAVLVIFMYIGTSYSIKEAVIGIAVSNCLFLLMYMKVLAKRLRLSLQEVFQWIVPGMLLSAPCLVVTIVIGKVLDVEPLFGLFVQISSCAILLPLMLAIFSPVTALELVDALVPGAVVHFKPLRAFLLARCKR